MSKIYANKYRPVNKNFRDRRHIADRSVGLYLSVITTTVWLMVMRPANRRAALNRLP